MSLIDGKIKKSDLDKAKSDLDNLDKVNLPFGDKGRMEAIKEGREKLRLDNELYTTQQQQKAQMRQINEKQIRSLRNRFSSKVGGALLSDNPRGVGLGESTGLPSKLGSA